MTKVQDLKKQLNTAYGAIQAFDAEFRADGFTPSPEWQAKFDAAADDFDRIKAELDTAVKLEKITAAAQDPARAAVGRPMPQGGGTAAYAENFAQTSLALAGFIRGARATQEEREALTAMQCGDGVFNFNLFPEAEARSLQEHVRHGDRHGFFQALSGLTGSTGGFTIGLDQSMLGQLEVAMQEFGGVLNVATIHRTDGGAPMPLIEVNDLDNIGYIVGEDEPTEDDEINFSRTVLHAYRASSKLIPIPATLIEDSARNINADVGSLLGQRLGRLIDKLATVGSGAAEPTGFLNKIGEATIEPTSADAVDELHDLVFAVKNPHRAVGQLMMRDETLREARKLRDAEGRLLWQPSLQAGMPSSLLGYAVLTNEWLPEASNGQHTVCFGNWSKVHIRIARQVELKTDYVMRRDRYELVAYLRFDSNVSDAGVGAIKKATIDFSPTS